MQWTWCRCQSWRGSSVPADSLRWLEKHFGGCYTLLFYPSAVSVCSLSLHTIKTASLAQAHWAWHRKWSSVRYPHRDPLPHPPFLWMKRFCAVHQRGAGGGLFCLPSLFLHLLHMEPCSVSAMSYGLLIRLFDNISGHAFVFALKLRRPPQCGKSTPFILSLCSLKSLTTKVFWIVKRCWPVCHYNL